MNQRMTSKQITARMQFGSLLLAGLLSGSAAAQLPLPASAPFPPTPVAPAQAIAPPTLEYVPSNSVSATSKPAAAAPKGMVNRLGINKPGQKPLTPLAPLPSSNNKVGLPGAAPLAPTQSTPRTPTQLVGHASASAALQADVMYAYSTEAAPTVAAAEHVVGSKDDGAVVRAPVPAQPLESLLDVDMSKLSPVIAPAPKIEMNLADESSASPAQVQTAAPPVTAAKSPAPAATTTKSPIGSGSFHLSDDSSTVTVQTSPAGALPRLPSMSPTLRRALPELPQPAALPATQPSKLVGDGAEPARLERVLEIPQPAVGPLESKPRDEAKPASIAASSSQRSMSLRIGSAQLTPQSPTTRVVERRSMSSHSPVINVQPVVHVVKPIVTPEATESEATLAKAEPGAKDAKLNVATTASKADPTTGGPAKVELAPSGPVKPTASSPAAADSSLAASAPTSTVSKAQELTAKEPATSGTSSEKVRAAKLPKEDLAMDLVPAEFLKSDEVQIEPKLVSQLNRLIKQLFPGSHVEVTTDDEGLVVDGVAASNADAGKILALVRKTSLCPVSDRVITKR